MTIPFRSAEMKHLTEFFALVDRLDKVYNFNLSDLRQLKAAGRKIRREADLHVGRRADATLADRSWCDPFDSPLRDSEG